MIEREGTWREVRPGMYVKDTAGGVWRVVDLDREYRKINVVNRHGTHWAINPPEPDREVIFLEPTDEEAFATLERTLGPVETMAVKEAGQPIRCPPFPYSREPGAMDKARAHLFLMHGLVKGVRPEGQQSAGTDMRTFKQLEDMHTDAHDPEHPPIHGFVNHVHPRRL